MHKCKLRFDSHSDSLFEKQSLKNAVSLVLAYSSRNYPRLEGNTAPTHHAAPGRDRPGIPFFRRVTPTCIQIYIY